MRNKSSKAPAPPPHSAKWAGNHARTAPCGPEPAGATVTRLAPLPEHQGRGARGAAEQRVVVGDTPAFASKLAAQLDPHGIVVESFNDVDELWDSICKELPDLLICEHRINRSCGLRLVEKVLHRFPQAKVLIATSYASIEAAQWSIRAGAQNYVTKPVSGEEVLRMLTNDDEAPRPWRDVRTVRQEYISMMLREHVTITSTARILGLDRRSLRRMLSRADSSPLRCEVGPAAADRGGSE